MRVFLNLCAGLDRIGVRYRVNDYRQLRRSFGETACVVGKPHVLAKVPREIPIIFGAAVYSHPIDAPDLFKHHNIRGILVPCEWMRKMCEPAWGDKVQVWPVGIDTEHWKPQEEPGKDIDVLVYDKIRWQRETYVPQLLEVVLKHLGSAKLKTRTIRYGFYREKEFRDLISRSRSMVFLCEHETQGIALLQTLSCGLPVFAWDRRGYWQDPAYFPDRVQFSSVSTVPYWDARCGATFSDAAEFVRGFASFWRAVCDGSFAPRSYVVDNLTLEKGARHYLDLVEVMDASAQRKASVVE